MQELATLYPLGGLDDAEREAFEAHMRQGCPECEREVNSFREVAAALGGSAPSEPPASLRDRLLAQVSSASRSPGVLLEDSGLLISRSAELSWLSLAPGIEYKPLFIDTARKYNTSLVRMDAGAHYPSHRHRDIEELFMLSGDLHVAGKVMRAGDYCRASAETIHGETRSEMGCLFLLMASQENQLLA